MENNLCSTTLKKKTIIEMLKATLGNVSQACLEVGISRNTFYQWKKDDIDFANQVNDIEDVIIDFVESSLLNQIKNGNTTATIFYLKTKGKHRGYIEKSEIEVSNTNVSQINTQKLDLSCLSLNEKILLRDLQTKVKENNPNWENDKNNTKIVFTKPHH